jgi:nitrate reductase gamma subunit
MVVIPYIIAYLGIGIFIIAVIARFVFWAKMPMHVRWELYPVAHEAKKAHYGGSYLEEVKWFEKKRESSLWGELKVMLPEIFFLVALWEHNRKLWWRSFPFHFGLYLTAAATGMMFFMGILGGLWPAVLQTWFGGALLYLIMISGLGGIGLGLFGAFGLLERRLGDPEMRDFTSGADIFNLVFFIVAFSAAGLTFIWVDRDFSRVSYFVYNLVTFQMGAIPGSGVESWLPLVAAGLLASLLAYIPLTHMSHFVGKYFAYHTIRWQDTPNLKGGDQEEAIEGMLTLPVSWSADHIQGDGKKSWAEVATDASLWQKK